MSSTAKAAPRFRVRDWVSYLYGSRRLLAQVVEDRGQIGVGRRRLFRVQIDQDQEDPTTTEIPEVDLEPAPDIQSADTARQAGFSTQNWPRMAFNVRYVRKGNSNTWT